MKKISRSLFFAFIVALNVSSIKAVAQKTMYLDVITSDEQYYGVLLFADSSGVFIRENGVVIGLSLESIDIIKTGSTEKDIVEIKGIDQRYYSLLPLLKKYSQHSFRLQDWKQSGYELYVFEGSIDDLDPLKIPAHPFLEIGGGFMSTSANEQMLKAFQPFGGTTSFWGLSTTYPIDVSRGGSSYFRFGVQVTPRVDVLFTYRNLGMQEIRGISDFKFYCEI